MKTIMTRAEKIKLLEGLRSGKGKNAKLKLLCRKALVLIDGEAKARLQTLLGNLFATASELCETVNDGILDKIVSSIEAGATNNEVETLCKSLKEITDEIEKIKI